MSKKLIKYTKDLYAIDENKIVYRRYKTNTPWEVLASCRVILGQPTYKLYRGNYYSYWREDQLYNEAFNNLPRVNCKLNPKVKGVNTI